MAGAAAASFAAAIAGGGAQHDAARGPARRHRRQGRHARDEQLRGATHEVVPRHERATRIVGSQRDRAERPLELKLGTDKTRAKT